MVPKDTRTELQQIIDTASRELENLPPFPFSDSGLKSLQEKIGEYAVQLIAESVKISRRRDSETVSSSYVEHASQYLVSSTSRRLYRHLGTMGGLFLGTAGSNILSIITTHQFGLTGIIVTFALTLIGTFMIAMSIAKE